MRQFLMHPWRVLAVVAGIALGAAVFTSVRLAVDASLDSFTQTMDLISSRADRVVIRPGGRIPEGLLTRLKTHQAVETASPLMSSYVRVSGNEKTPFLLLGLDPILDRSLRSWQVTSASSLDPRVWLDLIRRPYTLFLGQALAREYNLQAGDTVTLGHVHGTAVFQVLGILEPQGLALVEGGHVAVTDISTMQEFTGSQGWVDRIDLLLRSCEGAARQIRNLLPEGMVLQEPGERKETGRIMIKAYQINLSILSFVSLFVGMFLVYSLVSLNAASRRKEWAIIRSMGGSSGLLFMLIMAEGAVLGLIGWLLAIPLGSFLVKYLLRAVSGTISTLFVRVHVEALQLDPWELVLSFGVTLLIALLAAFRPAREATRIAPREAMTLQDLPSGQGVHSFRATLIGLILILLAWPVAKLPGTPGFPLAGYVGAFFLVAGFSLFSPLVLRFIGKSLSPFLRRTAGEPAFLAGRYLHDAGRRTAISVGALVTAMALFVSLAVMIHSFRQTVSLWVNQTLAGDFFVRPMMAGVNQYKDALPPKVVASLKGLNHGVDLLPYRRIHLRYGKTPYQLEALDFETFLRYGEFIMLEGDLKAITPALHAGEGVIVSEVFANQTGMHQGNHYRLQLGEAHLDLPILGVFRDYRTRGGVVHMALGPFQDMTGDHTWGGARFFFREPPKDLGEATAKLRSRILQECAQGHPLEVASGRELRQEILRIFDETFAVTTVLLLIALLVAGLGITTTLTVLVMERMRQLNTLVAVGAAHGQIRSMIFWEAVLMVMAGEGIGLMCGLLLAHLLIYVINFYSFGWTFLYRVDWSTLLLSLPLILATALVAALPAARMALRSSPALVLKES